MPYHTINDLPDNVKHVLPKHAQEIYLATFNNAMKEYGDEKQAYATAWASVERSYHKDDEGKWVKNEEK